MSQPPPRSARAVLGVVGEAAAADRYRSRGFEVIACNWRCAAGEIDVIARRADLLVFCEVKTRRSSRFGGGFEAVDVRKRQKVRALAEVFLLQTNASPASVRFDVASVWLKPDGLASVELFEDAF